MTKFTLPTGIILMIVRYTINGVKKIHPSWIVNASTSNNPVIKGKARASEGMKSELTPIKNLTVRPRSS